MGWPDLRLRDSAAGTGLVALVASLVVTAASGCGEDECREAVCVKRVAGSGQLAFNGDGQNAHKTDFYFVTAARMGADGRLFVMDFNNHRLRVVGADGRVSTVAGDGFHNVAVPNIPATASPLENPIDFAFTADGRIVFVSLHDPRVLEIGPDGILRVLAGTGDIGDTGDGGPASRALFTELTGIAVAPDGSVAVADGGAHRVRVVRPSGIVEAVAGSGVAGHGGDGMPATLARLAYPQGIAFDGEGRLLIADSNAHAVRRVAGDLIETIAGTGTAGFAGDGGAAGAALLRLPEGVVVGTDGTIFVADSGNHRVRRIDGAGIITTLAGTGEQGFDNGPALSASFWTPSRLALAGPSLLVADLRNSCVRQIDFR
jgi:hypothetical protein